MESGIPDQPPSRALSQQLAKGLLARLDLARCPVQRVESGQWLRTADQRLDALPYVESGRLHVVVQLNDQGVQVIPVTFVEGEVALLSVLFSDEPLRGDLVAAEPLRVRWLPIREVQSVLLQHKELLVLLVRFLAQRLREVRVRERGWLERGVEGRVRAGLARIALETRPADGSAWLVPGTHEHLALRCGVSRPKLSNGLKQLEHAGIVRLHRGAVEIVDYAALSDIG